MVRIMNEQMQKAIAQALVEHGYAHSIAGNEISLRANDSEEYKDTFGYIDIDPFSDTLEGRRQADALEDWLYYKQFNIWAKSSGAACGPQHEHFHQWRLDRIRWCFEQLTKLATWF